MVSSVFPLGIKIFHCTSANIISQLMGFLIFPCKKKIFGDWESDKWWGLGLIACFQTPEGFDKLCLAPGPSACSFQVRQVCHSQPVTCLWYFSGLGQGLKILEELKHISSGYSEPRRQCMHRGCSAHFMILWPRSRELNLFCCAECGRQFHSPPCLGSPFSACFLGEASGLQSRHCHLQHTYPQTERMEWIFPILI